MKLHHSFMKTLYIWKKYWMQITITMKNQTFVLVWLVILGLIINVIFVNYIRVLLCLLTLLKSVWVWYTCKYNFPHKLIDTEPNCGNVCLNYSLSRPTETSDKTSIVRCSKCCRSANNDCWNSRSRQWSAVRTVKFWCLFTCYNILVISTAVVATK